MSSFLGMDLKIEFESLVSDYLEAFENSKHLNREACRRFNRDPVAVSKDDDFLKSLHSSMYDVKMARCNLFNFILENKDNIQIVEPPDAEERKCV